ncbi:hypothetical protein [Sphingomonas mesophila]|uniref:hypothetical protein n=1 Tax=Sphingomonas mesophila TaxID=2303576 RepID=UPI000E58CE8B|nr:hypothetical protein [Sphingomonas mesophila]
MPDARSSLPFDLTAAAIPAVAGAWSAFLLAPLAELPAMPVAALCALGLFLLGLAAMRLATPPPAAFPVAVFTPPVADDEELLLDVPVEQRMDELAELLLSDPLPAPAAGSRVVQLFAPGAGHAGAVPVGQSGDASDALRLALDELRRSLARR